jgi:CheY-like chemotaxis protein
MMEKPACSWRPRVPRTPPLLISVPVIDGWSLAGVLCGVVGEQLRLVAVTTRDEPEEQERSRAAGFDTQLVRPVSPNQVKQTLRQLLAY